MQADNDAWGISYLCSFSVHTIAKSTGEIRCKFWMWPYWTGSNCVQYCSYPGLIYPCTQLKRSKPQSLCVLPFLFSNSMHWWVILEYSYVCTLNAFSHGRISYIHTTEEVKKQTACRKLCRHSKVLWNSLVTKDEKTYHILECITL